MAGLPILRSPASNAGLRFSLEERAALHLEGLLPPAHHTLSHQIHHLLSQLRASPTPLTRYHLLMHVLARDERLFFAATQAHLPRVLPMIYTPAVGAACQHFSDLSLPPRGMWLPATRASHLPRLLRNWPQRDVDVIVVSDCERILGLGDLGANGMPIPVGKLLLYSACGGVRPDRTLPVVLDVGCNNPDVLANDAYVGLAQSRVTGDLYDAFVDEFINAAVDRFGRNVLIQFEDFANANALRLLQKYRHRVCCFNDDIQGTAAVGLAGVLSALRIPGVASSLRDHTFVFLGAGSAGIGIASLIVLALVREGVPEDQARSQCYFVDSRGLVYQGRDNVSPAKATFAHQASPELRAVAGKGLLEIVKVIKPTALVGVSTIRGSFSEDIIREMGRLNDRPIIFALSNPTSKAECTAEEAYTFTEGRAIYASGSPFAPVKLPGRDTNLVPGQGNNSYIFPGLGLGIVLSKARHVPDSMLLAAADTVSKLVDDEQLAVSCVYPDLNSLMDISAHIAYAVCQEAKRLGLNDEPVDKLDVDTIRAKMYEPGRGQV